VLKKEDPIAGIKDDQSITFRTEMSENHEFLNEIICDGPHDEDEESLVLHAGQNRRDRKREEAERKAAAEEEEARRR